MEVLICVIFLSLCIATFIGAPVDTTTVTRSQNFRKLHLTTMKRYIFEGIDYDNIPGWPVETDCANAFVECVRNTPYSSDVCAYSYYDGKWYNMESICIMERANCRIRQDAYKKYKESENRSPTILTADWSRFEYLIYAGDGWACNRGRRMFSALGRRAGIQELWGKINSSVNFLKERLFGTF